MEDVKPQELRIGNLVWWSELDKVCEVVYIAEELFGVRLDNGATEKSERYAFKGIEINNEWLQKLGFHWEEGNAWAKLVVYDDKKYGAKCTVSYSNGCVAIKQETFQGSDLYDAAKTTMEVIDKGVVTKEDVKKGLFGMPLKYNTLILRRRIKYVHELQNFCYLISGKELKLKE